MTRPRVLVLSKRTAYRSLVLDGTDGRVRELIAREDPAVQRMLRSHDDHEATLREVVGALSELGAEMELVTGPRSEVEGRFDLVVTVGGDGTLLAASHRVGPGVPLLGVNSAPDHSVGYFCATRKGAVQEALSRALAGTMDATVLARMQVDLNGRCLHKRVLNDALFCHRIPAATSRYTLRVIEPNGTAAEEDQRSSGLWIGPAAGSTAAQRSAGGKVLPLSSREIQYVVREPYTSDERSPSLLLGTVAEGGSIVLRSRMLEANIYLDGHHIVHEASLGDVITMRLSDETLTVLGLRKSR